MKQYILGATTAAALAFAAIPAHAVPLIGTGEILPTVVSVEPSGSDLHSAVSVGFSGVTWGNGTNGLDGLFDDPINDSIFLLSDLGSYSFTSSNGNFTASSGWINSMTGSAASGSEQMVLSLLGSFTCDGYTSCDPTPMSMVVTLNQTGITPGNSGTYSGSAMVSSPVNPIPEPSTLAILGLGLLGFGMIRRRVR